jgi:hypothetical protein
MRRIAVALAFVLTLGCAAPGGEIADLHGKLAKPAGGRPDASRSHEQVAAEDHGVTEIGLERTRCYGRCPAYTVVVQSDGTFRYTGVDFVPRQGEHTGTVSRYDFNQLAQFIRDSGYMQLQDSYTRMVTDFPTVFTTVVMDGKRKVISNYADAGPTKLRAVEQLIDKMLLEAKWDETPAK